MPVPLRTDPELRLGGQVDFDGKPLIAVIKVL